MEKQCGLGCWRAKGGWCCHLLSRAAWFGCAQEELSPWSNAFVEKNGRKPGMQDVLATGEGAAKGPEAAGPVGRLQSACLCFGEHWLVGAAREANSSEAKFSRAHRCTTPCFGVLRTCTANAQCVPSVPAPPAGIVWLITRYKQYILLRDRLFTDTGTLRSRLDGAIPGL